MKQRMLCLFLALALAVGLTPAARAAGLENFSPVQSYTGQFADVPPGRLVLRQRGATPMPTAL